MSDFEHVFEAPPEGAAEDWTIPQDWPAYTRVEHDTWNTLYARQMKILPGRASDVFLKGLDALDLNTGGIPDFETMNPKLQALTGWTVVCVPGLVPDEVFFDHLANRRFPSGQFIRKPDQLDYLQEPDIFHDVFGHVPMLMDPTFADYMEAYDLLAEGLEKQGKAVQAQQILEKAAEHSPNALLRQKHLALLASTNQDIDTASQAWRQTVTLGTYSIHDNSDHYLSLAQSLSDLSEGHPEAEGAEHAAEALNVLSKMEKRFADDDSIGLKSRIVQCRVHAGQGNQKSAEKLLGDLRAELETLEDIPADLGLDYAKTLFRLGHDEDAKSLLSDLAARYGDNPETLQKIENLLDEPVGFRQKIEARGYNRDGIKAFESGDLDGAVEAFNRALAIVPDHAALNLNLIQVLLRKYDQAPDDHSLLTTCQECLRRLEGLPEQHRQHRRYSALARKLKGLTA